MNILHNIDDVRAEIMRLEAEPTFDQVAWDMVLGRLVDRPAAMANAIVRMNTARRNSVSLAVAIPANAANLWLDA